MKKIVKAYALIGKGGFFSVQRSPQIQYQVHIDDMGHILTRDKLKIVPVIISLPEKKKNK